MTSFRATPISNDITKIVRNHYDPKPAKPYKFTKVWNRTSTNLLEERPKKLWERHYLRRLSNLEKGFHSTPWEPYRDIGGEVVLDPYDLVLKKIQNNLDDKVWSAPHKLFYDDKDRKKKKVLPVLKIEEKAPSTDAAEEPEKPEELVSIPPLNGYRRVREKLDADDKIIRSVRCGQSYDEHVRQQQELQQKGEDDGTSDNDMVLMSIKDLQLGLVHMAESDSEEDDNSSEEDDTMSLEQERMASNVVRRMTRIRKSLALPSDIDTECFPIDLMDPIEEGDSMADLDDSQSLNSLMKISSGVTEKKERIRRDHLQYLECLYTVIVSLHNMKGRDLKSKTPLSLAAVKALEKYYNPAHLPPVHTGERDSKLNYLTVHRFHSKLQKISTTTVDSSTDGCNNRFKLPELGNPAGRKVMIQEPTSSNSKSALAMPKAPLNFGRRKSMRVTMEAVLNAIHEKKRIIIETWEDLVNLQIAPRAPPSTMGMHANLILKAIQWKKIGNQGSLPSGSSVASTSSPVRSQTPHSDHEPPSIFATEKKEPPPKKLPIWQQVASEKYPKSAPTKKKKCTNTKDVGNLAYSNRKKLHKIRSLVQQELEASLQKLEREQMVSFKMKYQVFDNLSPLFEEHVINMRRGKTNMARNVDVHHVPPSKWYDELREKTYSITGQNDPEINTVLNKLGQFSTMHTKTLLHAKAKLCLLVMSLPAYSILTISMQKAIKYVLETILLADLSMLIDWLSHRRIPLILDLNLENSEPQKVEEEPQKVEEEEEENTETEKNVQ